jgi:hypothetical protein
MSNNTFKLAPYDKFFGIIYKSFQNKGKELTPEMQKTVEIYDQKYATANERVEQQERFAPAPLATGDERVELAPVPLAPLEAKGQVKLQRFVQQKQQQQEQVKDLQSKLDSLQARNEQTEVELEQCHKTLAASAPMTRAASAPMTRAEPAVDLNALLGNSLRARGSPPNSPTSSYGIRRRSGFNQADQGGKRKTKFKRYKKMYNKTSKKYKNKNTSRY